MRNCEWLSLFRYLCFRYPTTPFNRVWAGVGEPGEVAREAGRVAVAVAAHVEAAVDAEAAEDAAVEEANVELSTQSDSRMALSYLYLIQATVAHVLRQPLGLVHGRRCRISLGVGWLAGV